jgi:hypothetical protein
MVISRRRLLAGSAAMGVIGVRGAKALEQCPALDVSVAGACSAMLDPQKFAERINPREALQRESQWCWAASISMVCHWYGYPLSQESIVKRVYNGLVNMPGDDKVLTSALNSVWESDDHRRFRISASVFSPALNKNDVSNQQAIDALINEKPLINGSRSHATMVARIDFKPSGGQPEVLRVHVIDPFPGVAPPPQLARFLDRDEKIPITESGGSLRYLASITVTSV